VPGVENVEMVSGERRAIGRQVNAGGVVVVVRFLPSSCGFHIRVPAGQFVCGEDLGGSIPIEGEKADRPKRHYRERKNESVVEVYTGYFDFNIEIRFYIY